MEYYITAYHILEVILLLKLPANPLQTSIIYIMQFHFVNWFSCTCIKIIPWTWNEKEKKKLNCKWKQFIMTVYKCNIYVMLDKNELMLLTVVEISSNIKLYVKKCEVNLFAVNLKHDMMGWLLCHNIEP